MSRTLKQTFFRRLNFLAVLSAILFSFLLVWAGRVILLNDLRDKGEGIAHILAAVTLDAVLVHNYATVERYVADIAEGASIVAVEVTRGDGEVLARHGVIPPGASTILIDHPITLGRETFGQARIALSTARVDNIARYLLLATAGAVILFHLLGLAIGNMALQKAVLAPLASLKTAISAMRAGGAHQPIILEEPDEFAAIGHAFNSMAATIRNNFAEIKAQQGALHLERNKLATIVGSMADGLFVTDNNGVIVSFNRSATLITGHAETDALGRRCSDLFQTSLCQDACALNHAGETIVNRETSLKTRNGRLLIVAVSSAMLFDEAGEPTGGVQTFRDITADKRRQEFFCHTEKLAAIGQLAAGVAHEINNPLSNILGYARYITPESPPAEITRKVAVIIEQTRKCSTIVRSLLDFSRQSGAEPKPFNLQEIIDRVLAMLGYPMRQKAIRLGVDHGECQPVFADARRIEQVALNLLLNAVQAVGEGGNIGVTTGMAGRGVFFTVTDDGPGIAPDLLYKVFEPFYTTKPVGEGTGLGLSICAGIIAEAGGSIDAGERPDGGALFTVVLPAATQEESHEHSCG